MKRILLPPKEVVFLQSERVWQILPIMHSFLLILGVFALNNISLALAGPPRATSAQVDLGYEIHTGFLNVKSTQFTLGSKLTNSLTDNRQLLQLLQHPLCGTSSWKPALHRSPGTFYCITKAEE
jgi:hypothetical protein